MTAPQAASLDLVIKDISDFDFSDYSGVYETKPDPDYLLEYYPTLVDITATNNLGRPVQGYVRGFVTDAHGMLAANLSAPGNPPQPNVGASIAPGETWSGRLFFRAPVAAPGYVLHVDFIEGPAPLTANAWTALRRKVWAFRKSFASTLRLVSAGGRGQ